jgi:5-methylcytosine-specific restriction enzyme A
MSGLKEIVPKQRLRLMDLVQAAGVDVSDWVNFAGGESRAASNPKYCYEWSFVESGKVVVLNLWHAHFVEQNGIVQRTLNMREFSHVCRESHHRPVCANRAIKMDEAIQEAARNQLPIRVIVLDGVISGRDQPETDTSRVEKRLLDPVPWGITEYDWNTGYCVLERGRPARPFMDQFDLEDSSRELTRRAISTSRGTRGVRLKT